MRLHSSYSPHRKDLAPHSKAKSDINSYAARSESLNIAWLLLSNGNLSRHVPLKFILWHTCQPGVTSIHWQVSSWPDYLSWRFTSRYWSYTYNGTGLYQRLGPVQSNDKSLYESLIVISWVAPLNFVIPSEIPNSTCLWKVKVSLNLHWGLRQCKCLPVSNDFSCQVKYCSGRIFV